MIDKQSKIYIAGHKGFVGNAVVRDLKQKNYQCLITRTRKELDLLDQNATLDFLKTEKPDCVILCAAKVGGILPNSTKPAEFLYENLHIQNNIIHGSYLSKVKKLIFLASSCAFPRNSPQPMKEEYLFQGDFEPTNFGYGVAKAAGIKMCEAYNKQYNTNYISLNPSNLYGIGDNFDEKTSHAMASLIRKVHLAKINQDKHIVLWGTGKACREWLYIEDLADIIENIMSRDDIKESLINIGYGKDLTMLDLAKTVMKSLNYECEIKFDTSKPDGMPRKLVDCTRMHSYNLKATTTLEQGIKKTYQLEAGHL